MLRYSKSSLSLQAFQLKFCISSMHATCSDNLIILILITVRISGSESKIPSSSLCNYLHHSVISSLSGLNILLSSLFWSILNQQSLLWVRHQVSHLCESDKITVLYIFYLRCLDNRWEDKNDRTKLNHSPNLIRLDSFHDLCFPLWYSWFCQADP
jgi:hypothetical protein